MKAIKTSKLPVADIFPHQRQILGFLGQFWGQFWGVSSLGIVPQFRSVCSIRGPGLIFGLISTLFLWCFSLFWAGVSQGSFSQNGSAVSLVCIHTGQAFNICLVSMALLTVSEPKPKTTPSASQSDTLWEPLGLLDGGYYAQTQDGS